MIDFEAIVGWDGNEGPPDDFIPETLYLWTLNAAANVRFGRLIKDDGRMSLVSLRPCRAMDLRGVSITTPGEAFQSRAPVTHSGFWTWFQPFDRRYSYEWTFEELQEAGSEVELYFEANADLGWTSRYVSVYFNGHHMGDVFVQGGQPYPNPSTDTLVIPAGDFNDRLLEGAITVRLEPCTEVDPVSGSRCRMQLGYMTSEIVHSTFGNREVCFRHRGFGFRVNGRGRVEPYTFIQPKRNDGYYPHDGWPAVLCVGKFSVVRPTDPEGSGTPGRMVAILPFEMPPKQEAVLESYPVVCGYETGVP